MSFYNSVQSIFKERRMRDSIVDWGFFFFFFIGNVEWGNW